MTVAQEEALGNRDKTVENVSSAGGFGGQGRASLVGVGWGGPVIDSCLWRTCGPAGLTRLGRLRGEKSVEKP